MRTRVMAWSGLLSLCALAAGAAEIQTTGGTMLLDLDAARFEDKQVDDPIQVWENAGSEPDFAWVQTHTTSVNPTYQVRNGAPCVRFAGSSTGSLTNGVPTPESLLGNQPWSVEGWIAPTREQTDERYWLSLTTHNALVDEEGNDANNYSKSTFRLDAKNALAVDHWGYSLNWGRRDPDNVRYRPEAEKWYHICVVHEASGYERLYVNGHLASELNGDLAVNGTEPCFIAINGIFRRNYDPEADATGWERQAYADFGQIRVQTGALTAAQVLHNFNAEKGRYGVTDVADALWLENGTWFENRAPAMDDNLIIEGDQPLVYDNGQSNAVYFVTVNAAKNTGLTIDNDTSLYMAYGNDPLQLGNMAGGTFTLDVKKGLLATPSNSIGIGRYNHGVATIGGDETGLGVIDCGSSFRVGQYAGGTAELVIKTNGVLNVANNFRISDGGATDCRATVEAGGLLYSKGDAVLASGVGTGVLDVYGTFTCDAYCLITGNTEGGTGTLNLHPGAVFNGRRFSVQDNVTTTKATLNVDSATIHTLVNQTMLKPEVTFNFKNEVTFDVDEGVQSMIATIIHDETEEGVGTIVKQGLGELWINTNGLWDATTEISSRFLVKEGLLRLTGPNVLAAGNTATFTLAGGTVCGDYEGGAAMILARLDKESVGTFRLTANNANENLDFSAYPNVQIETTGAFTYNGTIKGPGNKLVFRPTNGIMVYGGDIGDADGVPASVEIYGATATDGVTLSGVNDGMSGNISVFSGVLGISGGTEAAGGATTKLYLAEGTSLKLDARVGKTFFATRVDPASRPASILLTENSAAVDVDLSRFPGCRVGTEAQTLVVQTGAILPTAENEVLLGGGYLAYYQKSYPGFQPAAIADTAAGPVKVQIATEGVVNMSNAGNSYSGGTVIENRGVAYATADGFGAVPEEFDEANIYINDGVLRNANANFALAATRGLKVGPDGAELHPWGEYTLDVKGGLTGEGPVKITDGGYLALSGAHNTYNGRITTANTAQKLTIGGDEHFSWASEGGIETAGLVVLKNVADALFNDTVSGAGGLTKQGDGTLTVTKTQAYTGATRVEAGKLVLADGVTLAGSTALHNDGEIVVAAPNALGAGDITGNGRFTLLSGASLDLLGGHIVGAPSFDVQKDASLSVDGPGFNAASSITAADGASLALGSGFPDKVVGFDGFILNGSAKVTGEGVLKLTENVAGQGGSGFFGQMVKVSEPWFATFTLRAGAHGNWATDLLGAALVIQNAEAGPHALSTDGTAVGNGLEKSVAAILRLGYEVDTYNRYGTSIGGVIDDTNSWRSNALAAQDGNELKVTLTYDGTKLMCTYDGAGNHRPTSREKEPAVNLRELLGSDYAWIGFTGATGTGTGCELMVSDFQFHCGTAMKLDGFAQDDWWFAKYSPSMVELEGEQALQMTSGEQNVRTAAWNKMRVMLDHPFTATFKYRATDANENGPGYGFTVTLQNNIETLYGNGNESFGFLNGTGDKTQSAGYIVNIYKSQSQQYMRFHQAGAAEDTANQTALTAWNLVDNLDTAFTLKYDGANLSLTATRDQWSVTETRAINLKTVLNDNLGWIGFTGASSSKAARQMVHDFKLVYDDEVDTSSYESRFTIDGATTFKLADGTVGFKNLELSDGAAVTAVAAGETGSSELKLAGTIVTGNATVSSDGTAPLILTGAIRFPTNKGTLKLVGDVTGIGPIAIDLATISGVHRVLDLSEAKTDLTLDDFVITGTAPEPLKMDFQGGVLRVWRDVSTAIIFR